MQVMVQRKYALVNVIKVMIQECIMRVVQKCLWKQHKTRILTVANQIPKQYHYLFQWWYYENTDESNFGDIHAFAYYHAYQRWWCLYVRATPSWFKYEKENTADVKILIHQPRWQAMSQICKNERAMSVNRMKMQPQEHIHVMMYYSLGWKIYYYGMSITNITSY